MKQRMQAARIGREARIELHGILLNVGYQEILKRKGVRPRILERLGASADQQAASEDEEFPPWQGLPGPPIMELEFTRFHDPLGLIHGPDRAVLALFMEVSVELLREGRKECTSFIESANRHLLPYSIRLVGKDNIPEVYREGKTRIALDDLSNPHGRVSEALGLSVDVEKVEAVLRGSTISLDAGQAVVLDELIRANGGFVSISTAMRDHGIGGKPDRFVKAMPVPIRELLASKRGVGYRLRRPDETP